MMTVTMMTVSARISRGVTVERNAQTMNDATYTPSSGFGLNETVDREGRAKARDGARVHTVSMARAHVGVNQLTPCLCAPPCLDTIVPVAGGWAATLWRGECSGQTGLDGHAWRAPSGARVERSR